MLIVGNCIVSEDLADRCFECDLAKCKGACCVEGDSGAPVEEEELEVLERILPEVKPYMTEKGLQEVENQGVAVRDKDGDLGTPLIDGRECAYICYDGDLALCAIEKAFRDGKIDWKKPVSCHLYPVRVENYREFMAVNYHKWDICKCAVKQGEACGEPLYKYLKEPLQRKFGEEWYSELEEQCKEFAEKNNK